MGEGEVSELKNQEVSSAWQDLVRFAFSS